MNYDSGTHAVVSQSTQLGAGYLKLTSLRGLEPYGDGHSWNGILLYA